MQYRSYCQILQCSQHNARDEGGARRQVLTWRLYSRSFRAAVHSLEGILASDIRLIYSPPVGTHIRFFADHPEHSNPDRLTPPFRVVLLRVPVVYVSEGE
jgi:hypothetical protein